ncbi:MAG: hypothetical protein COV52_09040 [Gammaproteobacteria bacterium CG11_big_fil_rev_8_21_14_0_20_46_22]|nr:MAG: hypothetical protein COV52_09040 [Gammaproteobacteria bacterium CG11_big_fil_rev_8_21_14_0_20_46_22]
MGLANLFFARKSRTVYWPGFPVILLFGFFREIEWWIRAKRELQRSDPKAVNAELKISLDALYASYTSIRKSRLSKEQNFFLMAFGNSYQHRVYTGNVPVEGFPAALLEYIGTRAVVYAQNEWIITLIRDLECNVLPPMKSTIEIVLPVLRDLKIALDDKKPWVINALAKLVPTNILLLQHLVRDGRIDLLEAMQSSLQSDEAGEEFRLILQSSQNSAGVTLLGYAIVEKNFLMIQWLHNKGVDFRALVDYQYGLDAYALAVEEDAANVLLQLLRLQPTNLESEKIEIAAPTAPASPPAASPCDRVLNPFPLGDDGPFRQEAKPAGRKFVNVTPIVTCRAKTKAVMDALDSFLSTCKPSGNLVDLLRKKGVIKKKLSEMQGLLAEFIAVSVKDTGAETGEFIQRVEDSVETIKERLRLVSEQGELCKKKIKRLCAKLADRRKAVEDTLQPLDAAIRQAKTRLPTEECDVVHFSPINIKASQDCFSEGCVILQEELTQLYKVAGNTRQYADQKAQCNLWHARVASLIEAANTIARKITEQKEEALRKALHEREEKQKEAKLLEDLLGIEGQLNTISQDLLTYQQQASSKAGLKRGDKAELDELNQDVRRLEAVLEQLPVVNKKPILDIRARIARQLSNIKQTQIKTGEAVCVLLAKKTAALEAAYHDIDALLARLDKFGNTDTVNLTTHLFDQIKSELKEASELINYIAEFGGFEDPSQASARLEAMRKALLLRRQQCTAAQPSSAQAKAAQSEVPQPEVPQPKAAQPRVSQRKSSRRPPCTAAQPSSAQAKAAQPKATQPTSSVAQFFEPRPQAKREEAERARTVQSEITAFERSLVKLIDSQIIDSQSWGEIVLEANRLLQLVEQAAGNAFLKKEAMDETIRRLEELIASIAEFSEEAAPPAQSKTS